MPYKESHVVKCRKCLGYFDWDRAPDIVCPSCKSTIPDRKTKLSLDLNPTEIQGLEFLMKRHEMTKTEVLRKALSLFFTLDQQVIDKQNTELGDELVKIGLMNVSSFKDF